MADVNRTARSAGQAQRVQNQESFEERQTRTQAARILENYERLVWFSMTRNESIVQTRQHFQAIVAGFPQDDLWIEDLTPLPDAYKSQADLTDEGGRSKDKDRRKSKTKAVSWTNLA